MIRSLDHITGLSTGLVHQGPAREGSGALHKGKEAFASSPDREKPSPKPSNRLHRRHAREALHHVGEGAKKEIETVLT